MKRSASVLFLFLFLFAGFNTMNAQDTLTILSISDTHSMLAPMAPRTPDLKGTNGGIARAATVAGMTRMTDPNVLFLHGGDCLMGDLFFNVYYGAAEFNLLNALGLDVMAAGNHEFDLGPQALQMAFDASIASGGFSVVSSNLILEDPAVSPLKNYIKPYVIKTFGGIKAGIFSLLTPETNILSNPSPAAADTNIIEIASAVIGELKAQECNLLVCISHMGIKYDMMIAAGLPGINLLVSGHDHLLSNPVITVPNPAGFDTYIIQNDAVYSHMGKIKLLVDGSNVTLLNAEVIPLDSNVPEEPNTAAAVQELAAGIEQQYSMPFYSQQIGFAKGFFAEKADALTSQGRHDTPLGNLITDAFRWKTGTPIAIEVGGSVSQPIYQGPIVAADAFRAIGYGFNTVNGLGFRLVTFEMTGQALLMALEIGLSDIENNDELFPQVSGMKYEYNPANPPYSRVCWATVNNEPVNPAAVYTITGNEFLTMALSMFGVPFTITRLYDDITEFQVLAEYIAVKQEIDPSYEVRVAAADMLSFTVKVKNGVAVLNWTAYPSPDIQGFEVYRKVKHEKGGWTLLGFVQGEGSVKEKKNYVFTDKLPGNGTVVYKLRRIDNKGKDSYSGEVEVNAGKKGGKPVLNQNFPNPFNPSTSVSFSIPERQRVSLRVFNLLGEKVAELCNEELEAGDYSYKWDAGAFPSGIYFLSLQTKENSFTRKMLLAK